MNLKNFFVLDETHKKFFKNTKKRQALVIFIIYKKYICLECNKKWFLVNILKSIHEIQKKIFQIVLFISKISPKAPSNFKKLFCCYLSKVIYVDILYNRNIYVL